MPATAPIQVTSVQGGASATSLTRTFASNTTATNSIIVAAGAYQQAQASNAITDNISSSYTRDAYVQRVGAPNVHSVGIYSAHNVAGGSTTITYTLAASAVNYPVIVCYEVDDLAASPIDQTATNHGSSNAMATGTTSTTTQADEFILAAVAQPNRSDTPTLSASFTIPTNGIQTNTSNMPLATAYKLETATGTQANTFTFAGSTTFAATIATYKAAGGGAATTSLPLPSRAYAHLVVR